MLWIYVLGLTAGIVLLVPSVLQAIDQKPADLPQGFGGFTGTVFGITGLLLQRFSFGLLTILVASIALGLAAGAIHPEILAKLRTSNAPRTH